MQANHRVVQRVMAGLKALRLNTVIKLSMDAKTVTEMSLRWAGFVRAAEKNNGI